MRLVVDTNDSWITASALDMGFVLVTADRVFNGVPGLEFAS